ncbi:MAG: 3-dehydroquinate synthase, partial [Flavobacteriaceae bacterium]|nr:3-dehydroquinate synthase [Flavobacteriaceae bacterium]
DYINVPTTLLAIVDASVGGKTGIDFQFLKNQIGTFYEPKMIVVDPIFINTLSKQEVLSGYAEIFKHSLVVKSKLFEKLIKQNDFYYPELELIKESITIKNSIVLADRNEMKERKVLNFGHTLGHAIETNSLIKNKKLLHGFAISIGFILEGYLSNLLFGFPIENLESIKNHIIKKYGKTVFSKNDILSIQELLIHDKKNSHGKTKFLLLKNLGEPVYDVEVEKYLIQKAFDFYDA